MLCRMLIPRAVAVVVDGGKVLVIKRYLRQERADDCVMCEALGASQPMCAGHHYAVLPGGHVEDGETAAEAAVRELIEETTLTAEIDRLLWTGEHNKRPAYYYLMRDVCGTVQLSGPEAEDDGPDNRFELLWMEPGTLSSIGIHPPEIESRLTELIG